MGKKRGKRSKVPRFASDGIFDRVQRSELGTGTKLKTRSPRKKCWFCHIIAKYHVPDLWGVETVGFPVQNVYKMTYGDENATFEPLNPWPRPIIGTIHAKITV